MSSLSRVGLPDAYHPETSPALLRMGLALRGLAAGPADRAPRILELGCGISPVLHAAAAAGEYWCVDDDPARVLRAAERARAAGFELQALNRSLAETAADPLLPAFDMIIAHDVWSLAGEDGRRHILAILDRHLATGGIAYLSYAALPGWFAVSGPRDLAALFLREGKGAPLGLMGRLAEIPTGFFSRHPEARELARGMNGASGAPACLLPDWKPFHFAEMARSMEKARLSWGGPARLLDQLDAVNIPPEAVPLLEEQTEPVLRETVRDYLRNRHQRLDVFVKGERRLNQRERTAAVGGLRLALTATLEAVPASFASPLGRCELKADLYNPVLAALADREYAPKTVEELEDHPLLVSMDSASLLEVLTVLAGLGVVHPARDEAAARAARVRCDAFNARMLNGAKAGDSEAWLASPVLGAGLAVSGLEQLFLASLRDGGRGPREWGEDAWAVLSGQGRKLNKDGEELSYEQAEAEMAALAGTFADQRLPFLRALGVTPEEQNVKEERA